MTFTLQLHVSTWLTIVPTQKWLYMTSPCKRNITDSKWNHFIRWEPLTHTCRKSLMTPDQGELLIVKCHCKMSKHTWVSVGESDSYSQLLRLYYFGGFHSRVHLPAIFTKYSTVHFKSCAKEYCCGRLGCSGNNLALQTCVVILQMYWCGGAQAHNLSGGS